MDNFTTFIVLLCIGFFSYFCIEWKTPRELRREKRREFKELCKTMREIALNYRCFDCCNPYKYFSFAKGPIGSG